MHEHSPAKASDDHEQEHVAELLAEVIDKIDNLATEEAPSYLDREGVPVKGGRFHHLPDYDGRESPFVAETLIRASVYTKDDEPVIRTIGTSFYASPDRGTMGYEIYEDGRVVAFTNSEINGMSRDDNSELYEDRLQRTKDMLQRRQDEIEATRANRETLRAQRQKKTVSRRVLKLLGF